MISTRLRVGLFTLAGLLLIGAITVYVNDRPFWWRSCELIHVNIDDATGLKTKSPIRSLGLQIGFIESVSLAETHVRLAICITAPVEVLPTTKAYIRGEGFLGDKFVELKPVKYLEAQTEAPAVNQVDGVAQPAGVHTGAETESADDFPNSISAPEREDASESQGYDLSTVLNWVVPSAQADLLPEAHAETSTTKTKEVPVGRSNQDVDNLIRQVDGLVGEMTKLTTNLKDAIDPDQLKRTMTQLNKTLENAAKTLAPEGNLTTTAQRVLAKLEEAIEHMRDQMARVNRGEGSVGKLLNDPAYAEEIKLALKNVNSLLGRASTLKLVLDLNVEQIPAYKGSRGNFRLAIYPVPDRYYLLGITSDPRGKRTVTQTTTNSGGSSTLVETTQVEEGGLLLTGMLGKVLWRRIDVSAGFLHGDGTASLNLRLGPVDQETRLQLRSDIYSRGKGYSLDSRLGAIAFPFSPDGVLGALYVKGGLESMRRVGTRVGYFYGAGISFDDNDIKLLFALR